MSASNSFSSRNFRNSPLSSKRKVYVSDNNVNDWSSFSDPNLLVSSSNVGFDSLGGSSPAANHNDSSILSRKSRRQSASVDSAIDDRVSLFSGNVASSGNVLENSRIENFDETFANNTSSFSAGVNDSVKSKRGFGFSKLMISALVLLLLLFFAGAALFGVLADFQNRPPILASKDKSDVVVSDKPDSVSDSTGGVVSADIIIHLVGEINNPGVYTLKQGDRVIDAIEAGGGLTDKAVLSSVNAARVLSDGEQLLIPNQQQLEQLQQNSSIGGGSVTPTEGSKLVNLNKASLSELDSLPRVGEAMAQRIIDWRESNGGFKSINDLSKVSGIGDKTFDELKTLVTV